MPRPGSLQRLGHLDADRRAAPRGDRRADQARPVDVATRRPPAAAVLGLHTDGHRVDQVEVRCPFCGGRHVHRWFGEPDGLRTPTCRAPGAVCMISIGVRERIDAMRAQYPVPNGVVGLVPLHIGYAYERDGGDDVVGVVVDTTLGGFVLWLATEHAVQLAGQLVTIVDNRDLLRERLPRARRNEPPDRRRSRERGRAGVIGMGPDPGETGSREAGGEVLKWYAEAEIGLPAPLLPRR